jgi:hypothetical protein
MLTTPLFLYKTVGVETSHLLIFTFGFSMSSPCSLTNQNLFFTFTCFLWLNELLFPVSRSGRRSFKDIRKTASARLLKFQWQQEKSISIGIMKKPYWPSFSYT